MQPDYLYLEPVYDRFDFAKQAVARVAHQAKKSNWVTQPGETPKPGDNQGVR